MPRTDPALLDPARYPHREVIQTRFQDMDVMGHLNNVAYAALFETARVKFNQAVGALAEVRRRRSVVARVEIDYLAEGQYPGDVEIATGVGRIGGRSWDFLQLMLQAGTSIAACTTVVVMAKGEPGDEGLPAEFRARLEGLRLTAYSSPRT